MRNIKVTGAASGIVADKLINSGLLKFEIERIDITNYTDKFSILFIIFQSFPPNYPARKVEEFKRMRRKTKTLELYLVLDYDKIRLGTDDENLEYIKEIFFKGCETFIKPMKGFDWNAFIKIAFPEEQKLVA